ncbi:hypothetical protein GX408_07970 [bacterium]|nr:hypothetical protein [bacterium]
MKKTGFLVFLTTVLCSTVFCPGEDGSGSTAPPDFRDIFADTWVAADALGRTLPDQSSVGPVKQDGQRKVGIVSVMQKMKAEKNKVPKFCFWAFNGEVITVVQNLYDQIYKEGQYRELWFFWDGKPLLLHNDRPDIDADRSEIRHPNPHYDPAAKTDPAHPHYGDPDYTEAFYLDDTKEVKRFFTLRTMWWGYCQWHGQRFVGTEDPWSFGYAMEDTNVRAMSPDQLVSKHAGRKEQVAVTPGQHASTTVGKSWTREHGEPDLNEYDLPESADVPWFGITIENHKGYGIYFQQRWDEADPPFIYLKDWNEWIAGKFV